MIIEPKHILLIIALALLMANRILQNKPFFVKHGNLIRLFVFLILIATLALEFIKSKAYVIFIVVGLGIIAIGWIIYDMYRKDDDENSNPSNKNDETV